MDVEKWEHRWTGGEIRLSENTEKERSKLILEGLVSQGAFDAAKSYIDFLAAKETAGKSEDKPKEGEE